MDVLVDVDGTIADGAFYAQYLKMKPKNWNLFHQTLHLHDTIEETLFVVKLLASSGTNIIILTGRSEQYRKATIGWLHDVAGLEGAYKALYMRPDGDYRRDDEMKEIMLQQVWADGWKPVLAFEDRLRVAKMWRRNGIRCYHVENGDDE